MSSTPFTNIIVATDFSECSRDAVAVATELAASTQATLTVVHVWQVAATVGLGVEFVPIDLIAIVEEASQQQLEAVAKQLRETLPSVHSVLRSGVAWHQIVEVAREKKADLLVLGTHGRTGLKHVLLGSVAEKVVRLAPCAVLTVPRRDAPASSGATDHEQRAASA